MGLGGLPRTPELTISREDIKGAAIVVFRVLKRETGTSAA